MCHSRNLVAFCENCFRHNLIIEKHTFLAGEFHKESTLIFRLLAKNCIFEILAKTVFWPFFNEDERISMDNETAKICCQLYLHDQKRVLRECFPFFDLFLIFENLCQESLKSLFGQDFRVFFLGGGKKKTGKNFQK